MARLRIARSAECSSQSGLIDGGRLRAVLALCGMPWEDLDDGLQQVRVKLLETQADSTKPSIGNPSAWATVVASRVAMDWHRARARDSGLRKRLAARWSRRPPDGASEEERTMAMAVADALEALPAAHRQVIVLRFYDDLPVREVAAHLGVSEGTAKSRIHRAVVEMRSMLREMEVI